MDNIVGEKLPVFYTNLNRGRVEQGGPSFEPEEDGSGQSKDEDFLIVIMR